MSKNNPSPIEYADRILSNPDLPPIIKNNKELYIYEPKKGYYSMIEEEELDQYIHDFFLVIGAADMLSQNLAAQIRWCICLSKRVTKVKEMNNHGNLINLKNGIIDLDEKQEGAEDPASPSKPFTLIPHSSDYYFTSAVNVDYDPEAKSAPFFLSTLQAIFRRLPQDRVEGQPDYDTETVASIIRLGGYILYPQNKIKKMFIFYGQGANGKSIIMERVFKLFFTKDNMSALSLNTLSSEASFARHKLLKSRINFATEQKAGDIESEELKKIISGETISVDRKNKDWIDFEPNCKIIIAANRLPYFKDTTHGTDRRLHIIYFPNRFMPRAEYEKEFEPESLGMYPAIHEDTMVENLNKEAPAILNIFLLALRDLRASNWYFPATDNSVLVKEEYKEESDPVGTWLRQNFRRASITSFDQIVTTRTLLIEYENYVAFSHQGSKTKMTSVFMNKKVKEVFNIKPFKYQQKDPTTGRYTTVSAFKLEASQSSDIESVLLNNI